MKFLVLSAFLAVSQAGVLISTAPAHHFQAATAPAAVEQFPAAAPAAAYTSPYIAPAAAYTRPALAAAAPYTTPALAPAAGYTYPHLAPYAASYTVAAAAHGGVPAPIPGAALIH